jgi:hypothetical protein
MTPELQKELSDLLIMVIQVIVIPAISAIGYFVVQYLRAKAENVKNKEVRDALNDALTRLDLTAQTVVKEVNQTLKDKVAVDGKLTEKTGHDLLKVAYARLKSRLPADAMATLKNAFPDSAENENLLQKVIVGKIEKTVGDAKKPCVT